jgi:hypothetical protein
MRIQLVLVTDSTFLVYVFMCGEYFYPMLLSPLQE